MFMTIGQYLGARVVTAILVVSGTGALIWFWRHPEHLELIWRTIKYVIAWIGFAAILPWAGFPLVRWVVSLDSNRSAAVMLVGLVLVDMLAAFLLMGGAQGHDSLTWVVLVLGFLSAGVYNFKVCEYQADRFGENV